MGSSVITKRDQKIEMRCTEKVKNRIKILANEYAGGNVSRWLEYAALEATRKYLVPKAGRPKK